MSGTFVAADSLVEALDAVAAGARPVAGGTDLVVGARSGARPLPDAIVAIHALDELRAVTVGADGLRAGALVSHAAIATDPIVAERYTALADASAIVGSHATRAQGTIGGNVMNASPAMDTGGPLLCLGATVTLSAAGGRSRELPLDELWTGPGRTSADPGELLTAVTLPPLAPGTGSAYVRLEYRRQMEIAVVGATAVVELDGDVVRAARIAITALAPTIRRVPDAEAALAGTSGDRGRGRAGGRGGRRRLRADLRRPRIARVPPRDGGRHDPPRDHGSRRAGARRRRRRPDPRQPRAPRRRLRRPTPMKYEVTLNVNGQAYPVELDAHQSLLDAVRGPVGLTGSKEGCDDSECGACMMLLDGEPVNACSYLALQAVDREVTTIEGLGADAELHPLQRAFLDMGGVQCGFCTPGMLISATALLERTGDPSEEEVRIALAGNLCRCTGYDGIVKAVLSVAADRPR